MIYVTLDKDGLVVTARMSHGPAPSGFILAPDDVTSLSEAVRLRRTDKGWEFRQQIERPTRHGDTITWESPPPGMAVTVIDADLGDHLAHVTAPASGPMEFEFSPGRFQIEAKAPPLLPLEMTVEVQS